MPYTPININAFTASFAGAIAGMAVSGWIVDPTSSDYQNATLIAGAFAQAFDIAWNNAAQLNNLEIEAMTSIIQQDFKDRGPGPFNNPRFQDPTNWTVPARACAALILQSDIYFTAQGINPGTSPLVASGATGIAAITGAVVGNQVHETILGDFWHAQPMGTSIADGITIINATDGSVQWQRIIGSGPITKWLTVTDWYLDGTNGSDWNDGSATHPIRSGYELYRRLGAKTWFWAQSVTLHIIASIDALILDFGFSAINFDLTIIGTPTIILDTTINVFTDDAGNIPRTITATNVTDWTTDGPGGNSLINSIGYLPTVSTGTVFTLLKANPEGTATNAVCRISKPFTIAQSIGVPGHNDELQILSLPQVNLIDIQLHGYVPPYLTANISSAYLKFIACPSLFISGPNPDLQFLAFACQLGGAANGYAAGFAVFCEAGAAKNGPALVGCDIDITELHGWLTSGCALRSSLAHFINRTTGTTKWDTYQGSYPYVRATRFVSVGTNYFCDSPSHGAIVTGGASVVFSTGTWAGYGAAAEGVAFDGGAKMYYFTKPTVTGTGGDIRLLVPATTITWAANVPLVETANDNFIGACTGA